METSNTENTPFAESAKSVLDIEITAIQALRNSIDQNFTLACQAILQCNGRTIVTGMGKSGHIANKIAATLASTGTPAFFVHPGEASHGDLGMITPKDVVIAISNSGESPEILTILPIIKRMGIKLIGIASNAQSTLSQLSDIYLHTPIKQEACPLNLAPTASTTATLALGDALAIAVLKQRGFDEQDFARSHPGGALGRRLLLYVQDIMHTGNDIPVVYETQSLSDAIVEMSSKGLGMTTVLNQAEQLIGVFTDGDLRRTLTQSQNLSLNITDVMTTTPITIAPSILAAELVALMKEKHINSIAVCEKNTLVGALNMQDLLKAGVI